MNAPTHTDIARQVVDAVATATELPAPAELAGHTDEVRELLAQARTANRLSPDAFALWNNLGLGVTVSGRAALTTAELPGTSAVAERALACFAGALGRAGWRGALVTTNLAGLAVWDTAPAGALVLLCPLPDDSSSRLQFGGFRLASRPSGLDWTPVRVGRRVIAHVCGRKVALAFHPFVGPDGRLTVADEPRRAAMLDELFGVLAEHVEVASDPEPERVQAFEAALAYSRCAVSMAGAQDTANLTEADRLEQAVDAADAEVARIEAELARARAAAAAAREKAFAAEPLRAAHVQSVALALARTDEQLGAVRNLPQVSSAELRLSRGQVWAWVTTHPLTLDCGRDGLRRIEPIEFGLPLTHTADPQFIGQNVHPAVTADNTMDFSAVAVPLAQAIGARDLRAATSVVCGLLSRPLPRLPRNRSSFARMPDNSPRGFRE